MIVHRRKSSASTVKALKKCLAGEKSVRFAYIYGSFLKRRDARDVDVGVYLSPCRDSWKQAQEIGSRLESALRFGCSVDLHVLNGTSAAFAFEVLRLGRPLFERNTEERMTWEAHALTRYQDLRPMLEFHDSRFLSP